MKKLVGREVIANIMAERTPCYCYVMEWFDNEYYVATDNYFLAKGKELKGYLGDIIYFQYTGEKYLTGDYILNSDRHGMICKWKEKGDR